MMVFNVNSLRIIQQIMGGLLLLVFWISVDAFAADTQKRERSTGYFIDQQSNLYKSPSLPEIRSERVNGSHWNRVDGLPEELLNIIHDAVKGLLSSTKMNGRMRFEAERLKDELDEEALINHWKEIHQIIDFLMEKISKKELKPSKKVVVGIRMIGELLKFTTLPDSKISDIMDFLGDHFSREELNPHIKVAAIQAIGNLLRQGVVSDPTKRREIVFMMSARLDDESWEVRLEALNSFQISLSQKILFYPEGLNIWHKVASLIFDQNWMVEDKARSMMKNLWKSDFPHSGKVEILRTVEREFPKASYGKKKSLKLLRAAVWACLPPGLNIIYKKWIKSQFWGVRRDVVRYLYAFLREGDLSSFTNKGKILFLIQKLVTDRNTGVRKAAIEGLPEFLSRDGLFDLSERERIMFMAMNLSFDPNPWVQRAALKARRRFIKQGILTEELAIKFVNTRNLSALDKMITGLELDKQFSDIHSLEERQAEGNGACQEAMTAARVVPKAGEG